MPYGGGDSPELRKVIIDAKCKVFPWIRLNRVIRDIPNQHILAGNENVNLRQLLQQQMKASGLHCKCIRCREVGLNSWDNQASQDARLVTREYNASGATEYFISFESADRRLRHVSMRSKRGSQTQKAMRLISETLCTGTWLSIATMVASRKI